MAMDRHMDAILDTKVGPNFWKHKPALDKDETTTE